MKMNVEITQKKQFEVKLSIVDENGNETDASDNERLVKETIDNIWDASSGINEQDEELEIEFDGEDVNVHLVVKEIKPKYSWSNTDADYDLETK